MNKYIDTNKDNLSAKHITIATYNRYLIPYLKPDINKAVYLDVDIIAKGDVAELYNVDLGSYHLAAVPDQAEFYVKTLKKNMGIKESSIYFNAGILLIDTLFWRENKIPEKLLEFTNANYEKLMATDQDVLNKFFENDYKILDKKYNSMGKDKDTVIRHYFNPAKPWQVIPALCTDYLEDFNDFWYYAKFTPFYDELIQKCKYKTEMQKRIVRFMLKQGVSNA